MTRRALVPRARRAGDLQNVDALTAGIFTCLGFNSSVVPVRASPMRSRVHGPTGSHCSACLTQKRRCNAGVSHSHSGYVHARF